MGWSPLERCVGAKQPKCAVKLPSNWRRHCCASWRLRDWLKTAASIQKAVRIRNKSTFLGDFVSSFSYHLQNLVLNFYAFRTISVEMLYSLDDGWVHACSTFSGGSTKRSAPDRPWPMMEFSLRFSFRNSQR